MTISETLRTTITSARRAWSFEELTKAHPSMNRSRMHTALRELVESGAVLRTDVPTSKGRSIPYWRSPTVQANGGSAFDPSAPSRRIKYSAATVAQFVALLPATTATIAKALGITPRQVEAVSRRARAVSVKGLWHPHGTAKVAHEWGAGNDGVDTDAGSSFVAFVPSTETFHCARRNVAVTHAQCYDDHLNAECKMRGAPAECRWCPRGQKQRVEYAQGA